MGRISLILAVTWGLVAVVGCSFKPNLGRPGGNTGGTTGGGTGGEWLPDDAAVFRPDTAIDYITADVETDAGPTGDANCGNVPFSVVVQPPELLIVLDRSGSMNQDSMGDMLPAGDPNTKWALMTAAINMAVAASETKVNWGLKFFGTGQNSGGNQNCAVSDVVAVPPGPMNAAAIAAAMALPANQPGSSTPTRLAAMTSGTYMLGRTTMNPKFILLATDGEPTCSDAGGMTSDAPAAIAAVGAVAAMGVPIFVIGIAADGTAGMTLDSMAMMGGRPKMGSPAYYSVTTTADLVTALGAIQSVVGMCTYPIGTVDPMTTDLTKISVSVDGIPSVRDAPDGWVYDPGMTSITFTGSTCAQLMVGELKDVQILFGCKVGPVM